MKTSWKPKYRQYALIKTDMHLIEIKLRSEYKHAIAQFQKTGIASNPEPRPLFVTRSFEIKSLESLILLNEGWAPMRLL